VTARRTLWRVVGAVVVVAGLVTLYLQLPDLGDLGSVLAHANAGWLVVAAIAQVASVAMFGLQQRRLALALGTPIPAPRAVAFGFAQSALSLSMPGGPAVSAAFVYRQLAVAGATGQVGLAVIVLSGVFSWLGLAFAYLGLLGLVLATGSPSATETAIGLQVGAILVVLFGLAWMVGRRVRASGPPAEDNRARARLWRVMHQVSELRVRDRAAAAAYSGANWVLDLACLAAVGAAFGVPLNARTLGLAYLTVQIVRFIPVTPAGTGVVEPALLATLTSTGVAGATATAIVLAYRLASVWLVALAGLVAWSALRRTVPAGEEVVPS
jgi:uncharacterized membrane protein YbhN (UPF0104 family)